MKSAALTTAKTLGILAGLLGLEHGTFEVLQGNTMIPGTVLAVGIGCAGCLGTAILSGGAFLQSSTAQVGGSVVLSDRYWAAVVSGAECVCA